MPWGRLDDSMYDHPKIDKLGDVANSCVGIWARSISYCNRWLTDGLISESVLRKFGATSRDLDALVEVCLLERVEDGFVVHDFLEFNSSRAAVLARREQAKAAGRIGGLAKGKRNTEQPADGSLSSPLSDPLNDRSSDPSSGSVGVRLPPLRSNARAHPVPVPYPSEEETPPPPTSGGRRAEGTNQRAAGRSPRQEGTNPRAKRTSPRQVREAEKTGPTKLGTILAELDRRKVNEEFAALLAEQDAKAGRTVAVVVDGQVVEKPADPTWFDGAGEEARP